MCISHRMRPVHTWFLKITFMWMYVCVCVFVCVHHCSGMETHDQRSYVTVFWKIDLNVIKIIQMCFIHSTYIYAPYFTNNEIHFLPVHESYAHGGTKHLILDGQVCYYRWLFFRCCKTTRVHFHGLCGP